MNCGCHRPCRDRARISILVHRFFVWIPFERQGRARGEIIDHCIAQPIRPRLAVRIEEAFANRTPQVFRKHAIHKLPCFGMFECAGLALWIEHHGIGAGLPGAPECESLRARMPIGERFHQARSRRRGVQRPVVKSEMPPGALRKCSIGIVSKPHEDFLHSLHNAGHLGCGFQRERFVSKLDHALDCADIAAAKLVQMKIDSVERQIGRLVTLALFENLHHPWDRVRLTLGLIPRARPKWTGDAGPEDFLGADKLKEIAG